MSDSTICQSCGRDLDKWHQETGFWRCFYCSKLWHRCDGVALPKDYPTSGNLYKTAANHATD